MPFVLDASVTVCWAMEDETSATAEAARSRLLDDYALAPAAWWFEVRSALLAAERRRRTQAARVSAFLQWLAVIPVRFATNAKDEALFAEARKWNLTIYDAAYLELAQRAELPLATLDRKLAEAAQAAGVELL